jgi:hypothetical protein
VIVRAVPAATRRVRSEVGVMAVLRGEHLAMRWGGGTVRPKALRRP